MSKETKESNQGYVEKAGDLSGAADGSMPELDQVDALRIAEQCFWNHYCGGTEGANAVINATQNAIWMAYKLGKDRA